MNAAGLQPLRLSLSLLMVVSATIALPACAGPASPEPANPPTSTVEGPGLVLPTPDQLPKQAAYAPGDRLKLGIQFRGDLPFSHTIGGSWLAVMEPEWDPAAPDIADAAYVIYSFSLLGYDEAPVLALDWVEPPADPNDCYVGLANWEQNHWDWYRPGADYEIDFPSLYDLLDYFAPDGTCHVAVVLTGESPARLSFVRIGDRVGYWHKETVYDGGALWPSMALDGKDRPHIACRDVDNNGLRYCRFDGLSWHSELVGDFAGGGYSAWLVLDSTGQPHIAHQMSVTRNLQYYYKTDDDWHGETLDNGCAHDFNPAVVLDNEGIVYVCYFRSESREVKLVHGQPGSWTEQVIDDDIGCGSRISMAQDGGDRLHICYYDSAASLVHYALYDDGDITTDTLLVSDAGDYPFLSVGPGDEVLVALRAGLPDRIFWLVRRTAVGWDYSAFPAITVSSSPDIGRYCSLAVAADGTPHVAYGGGMGDQLSHSSYSGSSWTYSQVDDALIDPTTSLSLDSTGKPIIAYITDADRHLHLARLLD